MFSYRPRKPMYGGKLAKKKKAEAEVEAEAASSPAAAGGPNKTKNKKPNPFAQLRGGGPVERAIRSDLISLRKLFETTVVKGEASQHAQDADEHDAIGSTFLLFKDAFRRGKFGIIHTRCMPPRCDRAEFAQILYSASLGLLAESLQSVEKSAKEEDISDQSDPLQNHLSDAAFAVFALYTLYETNPLPSFPPLQSALQSESPYHAHLSNDNSLSEGDKAALTTLPLGLTAAGEQSRVIHRRTYKSPIRIGRDSYLHLMSLRDLCLVQMSSCEGERMKASTEILKQKQDSNINQGILISEPIWQCNCGLAQDCIQVINRLQTNHCLDFCEYAGPGSLEGLAGSANYYQNVVGSSAYSISRPPESSTLFDKEDVDECMSIDVESALELDCLEQAFSRYKASLDSMLLQPRREHERMLGRRGRQSNQALLIQQTLSPIIYNRQVRLQRSEIGKSRTVEWLEVICNKLKGTTGEVHGDLGGEFYADVDNESEPNHQGAARNDRKNAGMARQQAKSTRFISHGADAASEPSLQTQSSGGGFVRLVLPSGITHSLKKGIRAALCSISDDLCEVSGPSRTMPPSAGERVGTSSKPVKQSDTTGYPYRDVAEVVSELESDLEVLSGNEDEELSNFMLGDEYGEVETAMSHESRESTVLGGRAALQQLLSYAGVSEQTDMVSGAESTTPSRGQQFSSVVKTPAHTGRRQKSPTRTKRSRLDEVSMQEDLVARTPTPSSGAGKSALNLLLSSVGSPDGRREAKMAKASKNTNKMATNQLQQKKRHRRIRSPNQSPTGAKRRKDRNGSTSKRERLEIDGDDMIQDVSSGDDNISMMSEPSLGVGQNALHILLSRADSTSPNHEQTGL